MNRTVKPISLANGKSRWRLKLVDDPSTTHTADVALLRFIQTISDQPALIRCGPVYPRKFTVVHTGTSWVLEAEEVVDDAQSSG